MAPSQARLSPLKVVVMAVEALAVEEEAWVQGLDERHRDPIH